MGALEEWVLVPLGRLAEESKKRELLWDMSTFWCFALGLEEGLN